MLHKNISALFNPERFHGWGKKKRYFEGWYYKILSENEEVAMAIIPGIAMDAQGKQQAFIQVLDGHRLTAKYYKFDIANFSTVHDKFEVSIDNNYFSATSLELNLPEIHGNLSFSNQVLWPNSWLSPGIMGPFAFVPFMECYHGILSMDHDIKGVLKINNEPIEFSGGRGYMEKDWGQSFPSAYIWFQSNHFNDSGISIKASVAKIPWLGSYFVGFIAGLYFENQLIEFTTYNRSNLIRSQVSNSTVEIIIINKKYRLELVVERSAATELASPIFGFMDGRISESMTSTVHVKLIDQKQKEVVFEESGRNTALEVAGNITEILVG